MRRGHRRCRQSAGVVSPAPWIRQRTCDLRGSPHLQAAGSCRVVSASCLNCRYQLRFDRRINANKYLQESTEKSDIYSHESARSSLDPAHCWAPHLITSASFLARPTNLSCVVKSIPSSGTMQDLPPEIVDRIVTSYPEAKWMPSASEHEKTAAGPSSSTGAGRSAGTAWKTGVRLRSTRARKQEQYGAVRQFDTRGAALSAVHFPQYGGLAAGARDDGWTCCRPSGPTAGRGRKWPS